MERRHRGRLEGGEEKKKRGAPLTQKGRKKTPEEKKRGRAGGELSATEQKEKGRLRGGARRGGSGQPLPRRAPTTPLLLPRHRPRRLLSISTSTPLTCNLHPTSTSVTAASPASEGTRPRDTSTSSVTQARDHRSRVSHHRLGRPSLATGLVHELKIGRARHHHPRRRLHPSSIEQEDLWPRSPPSVARVFVGASSTCSHRPTLMAVNTTGPPDIAAVLPPATSHGPGYLHHETVPEN